MLCLSACLPAGVLYDGRYSLGCAAECRRVGVYELRRSKFRKRREVDGGLQLNLYSHKWALLVEV